MRRWITRGLGIRLLLAAAVSFAVAVPASAAILHYRAIVNGPTEPSASPGTGVVEVTVDNVANTMQVAASFGVVAFGQTGLLTNTTACHIHATTPAPLSGTAGVAVGMTGFPLGVTNGQYSHLFDLTLAGTYTAAFVTANGGTVAGAETGLLAALAAGRSYFNIHSSGLPGGEIRGFLQSFDPTPTRATSWARVKALFH